MDLSRALYDLEDAEEAAPESEDMVPNSDGADEDEDIALAIGTDDPDRVAAMRAAIEACVRKYTGG